MVSLLIGLSASLEGSVIEMKPAALTEDRVVGLAITFEWEGLAKIHEL